METVSCGLLLRVQLSIGNNVSSKLLWNANGAPECSTTKRSKSTDGNLYDSGHWYTILDNISQSSIVKDLATEPLFKLVATEPNRFKSAALKTKEGCYVNPCYSMGDFSIELLDFV